VGIDAPPYQSGTVCIRNSVNAGKEMMETPDKI
jgi:hypothetical protein